ncbi:Fe(3+)-hydroxamate ABC transporter permease FhuB [Alkalimarinus coralli]|uniref:Fe(3+)-hydroxamate ABC transporter permease FhuB n=1 Tax=Alkalimarinus coralli TaxID=2935863 RepID=UPI00202B5A81|nr:Fe(3+)-hydroxamate ABC transporter permease FhuB [Alkalimarinus coralli]
MQIQSGKRYTLTIILLPLTLLGYATIDSTLDLNTLWALVWGQETIEFEEFRFVYATLPRAVLAMLVGGILGLVGSVLQQATQNRLLSPMTLGASSGAWLALVCASVWAPALVGHYSAWLAMGGATLSVILVLLIAGNQGLSGLPVILAGMAVHILLGAIASAVILLNDQYAKNLFIWGAGDLTQTSWDWVVWLLPKATIAIAVILFAHRPLTLLRLGEQSAQARGLALFPMLSILLLASLWLLSSAITAVGVISFIGLLTPNIARALGARNARDELAYSTLLGAILLLLTDTIAIIFSTWSANLVPSGTTAALVGAPALLWFARQKMTAQDQSALQLPKGANFVKPVTWAAMLFAVLALLIISIAFSPSVQGWQFAWPSELIFSLRWPRTVTAIAAGAGMAIAGVLLQRLIRNPLASPDILGLSSGATLMLVLTTIFVGGSVHDAGTAVAFAGSMGVLGIIILLGKRHNYAPGKIVLFGIALSALIEALVHFALSKGDDSVYSILGWLAGSTYRATGQGAIILLAGVLLLFSACLATSRWLTLISTGDAIAMARGLAAPKARLSLLVIASLLCALITAFMGPVAFVGLLAPHIASILGAKKALPQLVLATLTGILLMLFSDWLGRTMLYPMQMPAGTIASIVGGCYFVYLLALPRLSRTRANGLR